MPHKIFILDDDPDIAEAIDIILSEQGYTTCVEVNPAKAIDRISDEKPDLILMDILMPPMDGRTICKELKQSDATSNYKIVMISAHPSAKDGIAEYGADDFLAKPFSTDELCDIAAKYLHTE